MSEPFTADVAGLRRALEALGDTPDGVAGTLRKLGVQGERLRPCSCPIAEYLFTAYGGDLTGLVEAVEVRRDEVTVWFCGSRVSVESPPAVREFTLIFDAADRYADLVVGS